ncbi:hypothetical protein P7C70_g6413, partial [Phenoliferia sp. Uapishka_3]
FLLFTPLYPFTLSSLISSPSFIPSSNGFMNDFSLVAHSLAWQMLSAVAYLHASSISHRDISPNNFVLSRDGRILLIDFGISIEEGDEQPGQMYHQVGTGPYRAPELLFTARTYDPKALDLWALGATLAEFFRPFVDHNEQTRGSDSEDDDEPRDQERWNEDALDREIAGLEGRKQETPPPPPPPQRATLFVGNGSDFALIGSIFKVVGTPTIERWPAVHILALPPDLHDITPTISAPTDSNRGCTRRPAEVLGSPASAREGFNEGGTMDQTRRGTGRSRRTDGLAAFEAPSTGIGHFPGIKYHLTPLNPRHLGGSLAPSPFCQMMSGLSSEERDP